MKLIKVLFSVGLGLALLMGTAMAQNDAKPAKKDKAAHGDKAAAMVMGEVSAFDAATGDLKVKAKDGDKTVNIKDAKIVIVKEAGKPGDPGKAEDIKAGMFASMRTQKDGDKLTAKEVRVAASADLLKHGKKDAAGATAPAKDAK